MDTLTGGGGKRRVAQAFSRFKFGFTLAEVLITLGIIGVVSSLTMPTLIASTRKNEFSARLKKFYSAMSQAIVMYNTDNNMLPEDWRAPAAGAEEEYWQSHFAPYFKDVISVKKEKNEFTVNRNGLVVNFSDGGMLALIQRTATEVYYDVNGNKPPNGWGRDRYMFFISNGNFVPYNWTSDIGSIFKPDEGEEDFTTNLNDRKNVLRLCKKAGAFCAQLLMLDGWEYKDDYPHRL